MSCDVPAGTRRKPRVRVTSLFCRSFLRSFTLASSFYGSRSPYIESREFTVAIKPLALFVKHDGVSARSSITCQYKCGNACSHEVPNTSGGEYFRDIARTALSRRGLLRGSGMAVLAVGAGQRPRRLFGRIRKCPNREPDRRAAAAADRHPRGRTSAPSRPTRKTRSPSLTDTIKPS